MKLTPIIRNYNVDSGSKMNISTIELSNDGPNLMNDNKETLSDIDLPHTYTLIEETVPITANIELSDKYNNVKLTSTRYDCNRNYNRCNVCFIRTITSTLLDIHISESHDSYFAVLCKKKPCYKCIVAGCSLLFWTSKERKAHLIMNHLYNKKVISLLLPVSNNSAVKSDRHDSCLDTYKEGKIKKSSMKSALVIKANTPYHTNNASDTSDMCLS